MLSRLLGVLVVLLSVLEIGQAVYGMAGGGRQDVPGFVHVLMCVGSVAVVVSYFAWRQGGHRLWLVVLMLGCLGSVDLDGSGLSTMVLLLGIILFTTAFGPTWALVASAVSALAMQVMARIVWGPRSWTSSLLESVAIVVLLSMGILVGQLVREVDRERRRNAELLDEVRRAAITEQELMLADERARSARELHDGLGHQLTLVGMGLECADRMWERDPDAARAEVQQARQTSVDALAYMRRWVRALNPPRTEALGTDGFEEVARSFRGTGLQVELHHTGTEHPLDQAASLFALRMVQEGLTNVLRHSGATHVDLDLAWHPSSLDLTVRDDGGPGARLEPGFGLRSMAERAEALGGSFEAATSDTGVVLHALIPTTPEASR